jgi:glycosyltransferase involved in cell wall biosynthesis
MTKKVNTNSEIPFKDRKKILILADDLRTHSGVGVMTKEIVMGMLHQYKICQIGSALNHPNSGEISDLSDAVKKDLNLNDAYLKIYANKGYGNPDLLREIISMEKPDAILIYTDPRYFEWLFTMEHEVRQTVPISYYTIWDDLPDPLYNKQYYKSCDLLLPISKQTHGLLHRILKDENLPDWAIQYIPHGINPKRFFKVDDADEKYVEFKNIFKLDDYKFKILYSNRNIRRKNPGDVILAYKHFVDKLPKDKVKEALLIFHTAPVDNNGTDLRAVCKDLLPKEYNVLFTHDVFGRPFTDEEMNYIFNSADMYINMASNEGFGLGSAEALAVETPIIVNVTGGLQDQCGFRDDNGKLLTADDYIELGSNHEKRYLDYGDWCEAVFPKVLTLQGSPPTPYIYDDKADYKDFGDGLFKWYNKTEEERAEAGKHGREFLYGPDACMGVDDMCARFINAYEDLFANWKPRTRFELYKV